MMFPETQQYYLQLVIVLFTVLILILSVSTVLFTIGALLPHLTSFCGEMLLRVLQQVLCPCCV